MLVSFPGAFNGKFRCRSNMPETLRSCWGNGAASRLQALAGELREKPSRRRPAGAALRPPVDLGRPAPDPFETPALPVRKTGLPPCRPAGRMTAAGSTASRFRESLVSNQPLAIPLPRLNRGGVTRPPQVMRTSPGSLQASGALPPSGLCPWTCMASRTHGRARRCGHGTPVRAPASAGSRRAPTRRPAPRCSEAPASQR